MYRTLSLLCCFSLALGSQQPWSVQRSLPQEAFGTNYTLSQAQRVKETGCNPHRADLFNGLSDVRCLDYLSNINNWDSVDVVRQSEPWRHLQVTTKRGYRAAIKLAIGNNANGPYAEVAAYLLDRALRRLYVEPVALMQVSARLLLNAYSESEAARTSLQSAIRQYLKETGQTENQGTITCSIQLQMSGAVEMATTTFLKGASVNPTTVFDFRQGTMTARSTVEQYVTGFFSDLKVFDYLSWNSNRPIEQKVVALQATCGSACAFHPMEHLGSPELIARDHSACFQDGDMSRNPITTKAANFCLFRGDLIATLRSITAAGGLARYMTLALPVDNIPRLKYLSTIDSRVQDVLDMADNCVKQYTEKNVFFY